MKMKLSLLFPAFFCVMFARCTKQPVDTSKKLSWLALGDSYTIGESVAVSDRFPEQTVSLLGKAGLSVGSPEYVARTGWTTIDLQNAIGMGTKRNSYDIVSLLIGVNDQYQGLDTSAYRKRFTQLLEKSIAFAGGKVSHVFVLSIPDYSVTPFGRGEQRIAREIDAFNAINRQVTALLKVVYVDITPSSRQAANDPTLIAPDGLHPSSKQYHEWAILLEKPISSAQY